MTADDFKNYICSMFYGFYVLCFIHLAGEVAIFSCATDIKAIGISATWMKDNKFIGDLMADRAKIVSKDNVFSLEIDNVNTGDKGNYTCRITNTNGEAAACSAQLEVHQCKHYIT